MIELRDVTKIFGATRAVDKLSLTIGRGGRFKSDGTVSAPQRVNSRS